MSIVKYNEWVIDLDEENTKSLYAQLPECNDAATRRYIAASDNLSDEEWGFFKKFYINHKCCRHVMDFDHDDVRSYYGVYYVYGSFLHYPPEDVITADEFKARNFQYDFRDNRLYVGRYRFDIQCPYYLIHYAPDDMPNGCICINFMFEHSK